MSTEDPSMPPPGPSRFLALPRELRDIIYVYALSEENGVLLVEDITFRLLRSPHLSITFPNSLYEASKRYHNGDADVESNQLKYVNHQLYYETKGLGLKLNDLTVYSVNQLYDFSDFIRSRSATHLQWIRKVKLSLDGFIFNDMLTHISWPSKLTSFCVSNPRCEIHLYPDHFTRNYPIEFRYHIGTHILSRTLRLRRQDNSTTSPLLSWRESGMRIIPNNLHLYPADITQEVYDLRFTKFWRDCYPEKETDHRMLEIEKWLREGIPIPIWEEEQEGEK